MRAVIYCRVSTTEQTENMSLATQERHCREFCAREGFEVAAVFVERGESAKTAHRPELFKLVAYCQANTILVAAFGVQHRSNQVRGVHGVFSFEVEEMAFVCQAQCPTLIA